MKFAEFESLYMAARQIRDKFAPHMEPWFRGDAAQWPPVIGFGLPSGDREVKLVTVGLNPSNLEIEEGRIPKVDCVNDQWQIQTRYFENNNQLDWFDRSEMVLTVVGVGNYSANCLVHLDIAPHPTLGGFDTIYKEQKKAANQEGCDAALQFLNRTTKEIFLPSLDSLARNNCTQLMMIYGFVPKIGGRGLKGNLMMKKTIGGDMFHAVDGEAVDVGDRYSLHIAKGGFNMNHQWVSSYSSLQNVRIIFLARGPSFYRQNSYAHKKLGCVGRRLRELGWL